MRLALTGTPLTHVRHVMLRGVHAERRVASLSNEGVNPLRPRGGALPAKRYTLDLYVPLYPKQDRVLKFASEEDALNKLRTLLRQLAADLNKEDI